MESEVKQAFLRSKPVCVEVSKRRDKQSVDKFRELLKLLQSDVIQALHEYFLFPLRLVLIQKPYPKEDVLLVTVESIGCVFSKISLHEWKIFQDITNTLLALITSTGNETVVPTGSEELKLAVLSTVSTLFNVSLSKLWQHVYHINNVPCLGHIVSICVSISTNDENRALKKAAIGVMESLCSPAYVSQIGDENLFSVVVGDCVASFLPGVLSALVKLVTGDMRLGKTVKCKALEAILKLFKATLEDKHLELANDPSIRTAIDRIPVSSQLSTFKVLRNDKWIRDLNPKLEVIFQRLSVIGDQSDIGIQLTLLDLCQSLLTNSCRTISKGCVGSLLKVPIKLVHSSNNDVSSHCRLILQNFTLTCRSVEDLLEFLKDEFFDLCSDLLNILRKSSDNNKLSCLRLMLGYIDVLKDDLNSLFNSSAHLNSVIKAILFCFQLDCTELHKIEEINPVTTDYDKVITSFFKGQSKHWLFRKTFVHFHNEIICQTLIEICRLLGKYIDLEVFVDSLLDCYENEAQCRQAIIMVNELLLGREMRIRNGNLAVVVKNLLEVYTAPENWYLCTSFDSLYLNTHNTCRLKRIESKTTSLALFKNNFAKGISIRSINSNIVLACLHLEAVATFSVVLKEEFRELLLIALYPVLEKVLESNHLISSCALNCLKTISVSCGYESIAELINENADYLVSIISVHLRHLALYPRSPAVLQAMVVHSDVTVFPLIRDTIDELLSTMDSYRLETQFLSSFLPVIKATVEAISVWFNGGSTDENDSKNCEPNSKRTAQYCQIDIATEITESLQEYYSNWKIATTIEFENEESKNEDTDETKPVDDTMIDAVAGKDDKKELDSHLKIIDKILRRFCHLLANEHPSIRLAVMDIIDKGITVIAANENALLPLVHTLWSPLTKRCADPEPQVVSKAFSVICTMGKFSGTFMRRRFTKDALPKLISFLKDHSQPPTMNHRLTMHHHTALHKLLVTVMKNMGPLLLEALIGFEDINSTCEACSSYLSERHSQDLQDAAVSLFTNLIKLDCDFMWLFLSDIYTTSTAFHPPLTPFPLEPVTVAGTTSQSSEYAKNISYLLSLC